MVDEALRCLQWTHGWVCVTQRLLVLAVSAQVALIVVAMTALWLLAVGALLLSRRPW